MSPLITSNPVDRYVLYGQIVPGFRSVPKTIAIDGEKVEVTERVAGFYVAIESRGGGRRSRSFFESFEDAEGYLADVAWYRQPEEYVQRMYGRFGKLLDDQEVLCYRVEAAFKEKQPRRLTIAEAFASDPKARLAPSSASRSASRVWA